MRASQPHRLSCTLGRSFSPVPLCWTRKRTMKKTCPPQGHVAGGTGRQGRGEGQNTSNIDGANTHVVLPAPGSVLRALQASGSVSGSWIPRRHR